MIKNFQPFGKIFFRKPQEGIYFDSHCTFELRDFADLEAKKFQQRLNE